MKIRPRPCYETGARCTTATYLFLSTTLMVAYLAKSGDIISTASSGGMSPGAAAAAFAVGMGVSLSVGGVKLADALNQVLTLTLLVGPYTSCGG